MLALPRLLQNLLPIQAQLPCRRVVRVTDRRRVSGNREIIQEFVLAHDASESARHGTRLGLKPSLQRR